jgi:amino acid transporter
LGDQQPGSLKRQLGLFQATAINVTMVVGAGVFVTIPLMLGKLPGPYALLGWIAAGALMVVDGLVWSELGAAFPGSGGSYVYLLECFGRNRWGRFMAFLFIWQFLISGPLEIASGLIAADGLAEGLSENVEKFNKAHKTEYVFEWKDFDGQGQKTTVTFSPIRWTCVAVGAFCIFLLYRRVTSLGRMAVVFWIGILAAVAWILIEGMLHFNSSIAFDLTGEQSKLPQGTDFAMSLGQAMMLAMYSYIGYYNICYMGDEVHEPGRNIPRSIIITTLLVVALFVGLHLAMVGSVAWQPIKGKEGFNLPQEFMKTVRSEWAGQVVTFLIFGSIFASAFSGLLGYSRIPYGAARAGHFFSAASKVHPEHEIPHISLFLVGGLTLAWSFFDFGSVLNAVITTRLLIQFVGQIVGLILLRRMRPEGPWPFRMWLYPIPCGLALVGWLFLFLTSGLFFIVVSLATLVAGVIAFFIWSATVKSWPFANGSPA